MTRRSDQESSTQIGSFEQLAYLPASIWVGKKRFKPTLVDRHVVWYCKKLAQSRSLGARTGDSGRRLMTYRSDFRRIQQFNCSTGLIWCFLNPDLIEEQRLAVWLLGRSHQQIDPRILMRHARSCPVSVRREIVKSLRRMGAHQFAAEAARGEKDARLRSLAAGVKRDFRRILTKWKVAEAAAIPPAARPFELFVELQSGPHRVKTGDWIRTFLEHIRMLLSSAQ